MSETKHTPGEWKTTPSFSHVFVDEDGGPSGVICKMASRNDTLQWACDAGSLENSANAQLIISASRMLEAIEDFLSRMQSAYSDAGDVWFMIEQDALEELHAAIAKAKATP